MYYNKNYSDRLGGVVLQFNQSHFLYYIKKYVKRMYVLKSDLKPTIIFKRIKLTRVNLKPVSNAPPLTPIFIDHYRCYYFIIIIIAIIIDITIAIITIVLTVYYIIIIILYLFTLPMPSAEIKLLLILLLLLSLLLSLSSSLLLLYHIDLTLAA